NALRTRSCFAIRASAARTTAAALVRPSQTAAAISLACAQAVSIRPGPRPRRPAPAPLRPAAEIREQGRERERHLEIGLDGAFPGRLELETERMRRRVDKAVEGVASRGLTLHPPAFGTRRFRHGNARRFEFSFAQRFGLLRHCTLFRSLFTAHSHVMGI